MTGRPTIKTSILLITVFLIISNYSLSQKKITTAEALNNIGNVVTICDKIIDATYLENSPSKLTLLNVGGVYPNQKLTIVINGESRANFPPRPEIFYLNKTICVTGKLVLFRDKPQIQISSPANVVEIHETFPAIPQPSTANLTLFEKTTRFNFEAGASLGTMNGATDIGRKKSSVAVDWKSAKANISLYGGVMYKNLFGARMDLTYGRVAGEDKNGLYPYRNLSYRSRIFEVAAIGEYYPVVIDKFSPYVMAGIGFFSFKPQTNYDGNWIDLKPLRTEGQGFEEYPGRSEYKLTQLCLPFGLGVKYELTPLLNLRVEWLYRYTSTDYLDDASKSSVNPSLFVKYLSAQDAAVASALTIRSRDYTIGYLRGGTKTEDKYFTINVKLGYKLGNLGIQ